MSLDWVLRLSLLAGVIVVFLGVYAIAYTNWNAYHAPVIEEVPTRYFLGLLPLFLVAVLPAAVRIDALERRIDLRLVLTVLVTAVLAITIVSLWHFHYTGPALFGPIPGRS